MKGLSADRVLVNRMLAVFLVTLIPDMVVQEAAQVM